MLHSIMGNPSFYSLPSLTKRQTSKHINLMYLLLHFFQINEVAFKKLIDIPLVIEVVSFVLGPTLCISDALLRLSYQLPDELFFLIQDHFNKSICLSTFEADIIVMCSAFPHFYSLGLIKVSQARETPFVSNNKVSKVTSTRAIMIFFFLFKSNSWFRSSHYFYRKFNLFHQLFWNSLNLFLYAHRGEIDIVKILLECLRSLFDNRRITLLIRT